MHSKGYSYGPSAKRRRLATKHATELVSLIDQGVRLSGAKEPLSNRARRPPSRPSDVPHTAAHTSPEWRFGCCQILDCVTRHRLLGPIASICLKRCVHHGDKVSRIPKCAEDGVQVRKLALVRLRTLGQHFRTAFAVCGPEAGVSEACYALTVDDEAGWHADNLNCSAQAPWGSKRTSKVGLYFFRKRSASARSWSTFIEMTVSPCAS
jgi:hypothetical protein